MKNDNFKEQLKGVFGDTLTDEQKAREELIEKNREAYEQKSNRNTIKTGNFIQVNPYDFAEKMFGNIERNILEGSVSENHVRRILGSIFTTKTADNRTATEYAKNMIRAKLESIYIQHAIKINKGIDLVDMGCEGDKVFVTGDRKRLSHEPDFCYLHNNKEIRYVELVSCKGSFWTKHIDHPNWGTHLTDEQKELYKNRAVIDLRGNKLPYLQKMAENGHKVYLLAVDIEKRQYYMIKIEDAITMQKKGLCVPNGEISEMGSKSGWRLNIDPSIAKPLDKIEHTIDIEEVKRTRNDARKVIEDAKKGIFPKEKEEQDQGIKEEPNKDEPTIEL